MRAHFIVPAFVAVLALTLAACSSPGPTASPTATATATAPATATPTAPPTATAAASEPASAPAVNIADFRFSPAEITIDVGATVTWTNRGSTTHTVTFDDGSIDSGSLEVGNTFEHTFDTAGSFTYHCNIHPQMTGTVTVQ